ncbi:uncharacterized protein LOC105734787 [Apis florea]|uniref:uncharacterized protein LOC105734787 n=1 Tax=Apis florea TaxID=7463 RepID=UPI000629D006|nr:uncharacterized protein LOC105734787 [Apis florea]
MNMDQMSHPSEPRYTFTIKIITVISLRRLKLRRPLTTPSTAVEVLSHRTGPREAETGRKGGNNGRERTDERATDGRTNERTDSVRCSSIRTLTGIHTSQSNLVGNQPALMLLLLLGAPAARCSLLLL